MKTLRFVILSLLLTGCAAGTGSYTPIYGESAVERSGEAMNQVFANEATNAAIGANTQAIYDSNAATTMNSLGRR